ncbi:MAG: T9SS type A sorting domain-containing protein [Planktothrix rubescens PR223]|jgi:hypothetical protein
MKRKNLLKTGTWLLFALLFLNAPVLRAQNSCGSAVSLPDSTISQTLSGNTSNWYSFTTNSQYVQLSVVAKTAGFTGVTTKLYSGLCSGLTLIGTGVYLGNELVIYKDVTIGATYYLQVENAAAGTVGYDLSKIATPFWAASCACNTFTQNPNNTCEAVCNGGFDSQLLASQNSTISPNLQGQLHLACPWNRDSSQCYTITNPITGTSDLYSQNATTMWDIPQNYFGNQSALNGSFGYAGIYTYGEYHYNNSNPSNPLNVGSYREYLVAPLNYPLQAGKSYTVTFWVSRADNCKFASRNIGAWLTGSYPIQPCISGGVQNLNVPVSQLAAVETNYITNVNGWTPITATYTSVNGGEQYIVIGNFESNAAQQPQQIGTTLPFSQMTQQDIQYYSAYYYVDGVSVRPVGVPSLAVTPNPVCSDQPFTITASLTPANPAATWTWNSLAGFNCTNANCSTIQTQTTTVNSYSATTVLSNYNNCTTTASITVVPQPSPVVNAGADITVCLGQPISLNGTASGTYTSTSWATNLGTVCVGCPSVSITATQGLQYAVFSAVNAATGCTDTDTLLINLTQLQGVSLIPTLGYASNILCANVQYTVYGAPAGSQFQWSQTSTPVAVTGAVTGLGQYTANWSTQPLTSASISCTVVAPDGCSAVLTIPVVDSCCYPVVGDRSIVLNNSNSSTFLSSILAQCPTCTVSGNTVTSPAPLSISVHINGSFTIDQNLVLVNFGNIRMGTNAAIYIPGGKAFEMRTCTTTTYCGMMWDGIYAIGSTAAFKATQNTVLQQAKNAVVSSGGGAFTVENTTIRNCLKGIVVTPYSAAAHMGRVRATTIEMPGTFLPASPALPASYNKTLIGIEIDRVSNITIGDATLATYQNTFNGIYKGIYAVASNTTVRNSRFINLPISGSNPIPLTGTAIHCEGLKNIPWQQAINVGGTAVNQRCTFDNVRKGLLVNLAHNVNFVGNTITNLSDNLFSFGMGVSVQNCVGRNINVSSNRISNQNSVTGFTYGIIATDVSGSTVNITSNRILQSANIASNYAQQKGIGIFVQNAIAAPVTLNIFNNDTIRRFMYGVAVTNISNTSQGFVNQNRILIDKPKTAYTQLHCGISIMNCTMIKADTNRVIRTSSPNWIASDPPSQATNLRGVYITNSQGCVVSDNTLTGMGEGVHANNNCVGSFFVCNVFQNSYRGFMGSGSNTFNAVILDDQLLYNNVGYPTGNSFSGSVTSDLVGAIRNSSFNPITWYYSGVIPSFSGLSPNSLVNNQPTLSSNPTQCANPIFVAPSESAQREILAGSQMEISESPTADAMTKEMSAKDAHRLLVEHPDWLNLNTAQDGDYQQFFAEKDTTELAQANYAELAALADNEQQAILQNAALAGASDLTGNHKTVFEIYNRTWLKDSVMLTPADSATLLAIALQHPAQGGEAVYTARVMLRLMVDDATGTYSSYRVATVTENTTSAVEVFPNPANTQVTITGHYSETDVVIFSLYDVTGRILLNETLKTGNGSLTVDLSTVQPGAYLYQITVNGTITATNKLNIAR